MKSYIEIYLGTKAKKHTDANICSMLHDLHAKYNKFKCYIQDKKGNVHSISENVEEISEVMNISCVDLISLWKNMFVLYNNALSYSKINNKNLYIEDIINNTIINEFDLELQFVLNNYIASKYHYKKSKDDMIENIELLNKKIISCFNMFENYKKNVENMIFSIDLVNSNEFRNDDSFEEEVACNVGDFSSVNFDKIEIESDIECNNNSDDIKRKDSLDSKLIDIDFKKEKEDLKKQNDDLFMELNILKSEYKHIRDDLVNHYGKKILELRILFKEEKENLCSEIEFLKKSQNKNSIKIKKNNQEKLKLTD